jgi:hypothetical protein
LHPVKERRVKEPYLRFCQAEGTKAAPQIGSSTKKIKKQYKLYPYPASHGI